MSVRSMHSRDASQVKQQTLILWGEDDQIISYKLAVVSTKHPYDVHVLRVLNEVEYCPLTASKKELTWQALLSRK